MRKLLTVLVISLENVVIFVVLLGAHALSDLFLKRIFSASSLLLRVLLLNVQLATLDVHHLFQGLECRLDGFDLVIGGPNRTIISILYILSLALNLLQKLIKLFILRINLLLQLHNFIEHNSTTSQCSNSYSCINLVRSDSYFQRHFNY